VIDGCRFCGATVSCEHMHMSRSTGCFAREHHAEAVAHALKHGNAALIGEDGEVHAVIVIPKAAKCDALDCVVLRERINALHDMVDATDPDDIIGVALTRAGLARRT
jgi:hypothetical protein